MNNSDTNSEPIKVDLDKSSPKHKKYTDGNTEQASEVSTSNDCDVMLQTKPQDITLILSAEEEAELCNSTNEEVKKDEPKSASPEKPKRLKKHESKSVWVSNISRTTKAADLKKIFSGTFKVESAKIVTNGKSFFGYITLETTEMAQKAVNALNGFNLAGRMIVVSVMRPDLQASRASIGEQTKRGKEGKNQLDFTEAQKDKENKQEATISGSKETVKDSTDSTVKKKQDGQVTKASSEDKINKHQRHEAKTDKTDKVIENLKKELNTVTSELRITKRRLKDSNNRLEAERSRKAELMKEVETLESQIKVDRRRMNQEREQAEKQIKLEKIRYEADRAITNKELEECKNLREYLQMKVDEVRRHRSRSPISRSPVRRAGPSGRSLPDRGHIGMDKIQRSRELHISPPKQRGYEAGQDRQRSPPPAPKLNRRSPPRNRERSPPYKANKKPRMDYPVCSYPSGSSGDTRTTLAHYPPTNSLSAPARGSMWNPAYKMAYKYSPTLVQSSYSLNQGEIMHPPRLNSTKPLEYPEFHKRMVGGPRKY